MEARRVGANEPVSLDDFDGTGNLVHAPWARELASPRADVTSWVCDLERASAALAMLTPLLSVTEHQRAARFGTDALRNRWVAGRATLRILLGLKLGMAPALVGLQRGRRGRPHIEHAQGIDFNVSHTGSTSVIAIAEELRIGVDIERVDRRLAADKLARKFLSAREAATMTNLSEDERRRRFLRHWTCKEAMSKATGDGLIAPFARIETELGTTLEVLAGPAPYAAEDWELVAIDDVPEHFVTLAVWHGYGDAARSASLDDAT
jgi:4'-phosphopantetheinyl transferase